MLEKVHFAGLHFINILQCMVQKTYDLVFQVGRWFKSYAVLIAKKLPCSKGDMSESYVALARKSEFGSYCFNNIPILYETQI